MEWRDAVALIRQQKRIDERTKAKVCCWRKQAWPLDLGDKAHIGPRRLTFLREPRRT